jgi:Tfp pilus assembly protein PilF
MPFKFFQRRDEPDDTDMQILEQQLSVLEADRMVARERAKNYSERGDTVKARQFERRLSQVERKLERMEDLMTDLKSAADDYDAMRRFG